MAFQSTRPVRGATISLTLRRSAALYFNPRAPCGRDGLYGYSRYLLPEFQSTRPVRARLQATAMLTIQQMISIHAPRAGATIVAAATLKIIKISIHAPRAGATIHPGHLPRREGEFQSTRPVRARRDPVSGRWVHQQKISIHAPRAGATNSFAQRVPVIEISIHAPRAGATVTLDNLTAYPVIFQSTRPVRARLKHYRILPTVALFQSTRPVRARL